MTINEAITVVITTQFKKDMGEALEIIKAAGFEARKIDGGWEVYNPETGRYIFISRNTRRYKDYLRYGTFGQKSIEIKNRKIFDVFDFENYMRKPLNKEFYIMRDTRREEEWRSPTRRKYEKLNDAKNSIKYRKEDIIRIKKKIEDLQKDLEREIRWEIESEQTLKNVRRELKLKN